MPSLPVQPKPRWLKNRLPAGAPFRQVQGALASRGLHTVCDEARCPNKAECWGAKTATFLIMGQVCTRGCRFCAVTRGNQGQCVPDEPAKVAQAAAEMGLKFVVVTSVTRDDLPDGGAGIFAETVRAVKALPQNPGCEVLTPDYLGQDLATVLAAGPEVFAHNLEVVRRLSPRMRHARFDYEKSLETLRQARVLAPEVITKSSLMLGLGETRQEIADAMADMLDAGVGILVLGQYLQPTPANAPVERYLPPEEFEELADLGRRMGFGFVAAAPLARTSYRAAEAYVENLTQRRKDARSGKD